MSLHIPWNVIGRKFLLVPISKALAMPRKRRPPADWEDDLFSAEPESFIEIGLSGMPWPAQRRFPINHARVHVRDVVAEDLRTSSEPLLIAGYSSIAALIELVADWRHTRGDRLGTIRLLLGSEPFPSQRTHFRSAREEFTEEVREYWLERSVSVRLSAKVIRVIEELDVKRLQVRVIPGPTHLHAKVYIGDSAATVGSSNYTDYGLARQLEANARFEKTDEPARYSELVTVASNLWSRGFSWEDEFRRLLLGLLQVVSWQEALVLQPHFVVVGLSSLVVADFGAVLMTPAPQGPGLGCTAGGKLGHY